MKNLRAIITGSLILAGVLSGVFFLSAYLDGYGDARLWLYFFLLFFVCSMLLLAFLAAYARLKRMPPTLFQMFFLFGAAFVSFVVFFIVNYLIKYLFPQFSQPAFYSFPRNLSFLFGLGAFLWLSSLKHRISKRLVLMFLVASAGVWTIHAAFGINFLRRVGPLPAGPNVLLLSIESLRYDFLGCNGNPDIQSPSIDSLSREGVTFDNYFVQAPYTTASLSTLMTGLYPFQHGSRVFGQKPDPARRPFIEVFARNGYLVKIDEAYFTSLFPSMADFYVQPRSRLGKALFQLDSFIDIINGQAGALLPSFFGPYGFGRTTSIRQTSRLLRNIRRHRDQRWFFWTHFQAECHWPYQSPPHFLELYQEEKLSRQTKTFLSDLTLLNENPRLATEKLRGEVRAAYSAEVSCIDRQIGYIIGQLRRLGLLEKTVIILTTDHGEMLGENGFFGHGEYLREELLHVPLIISARGSRHWKGGVRIGALAEEVDIAPTIMEICGFAREPSMSGRSLLGIWGQDGWKKDRVYAELVDVKGRFFAGLRTREFEYVWDAAGNKPRLYEIHEDPREVNDPAATRPEPLAEMRRLLLDLTGYETLGALRPVGPPRIDDQMREQMKALGYINH